jgi:hypothetical protein
MVTSEVAILQHRAFLHDYLNREPKLRLQSLAPTLEGGARKCSFKGTCWVGAVSKAGGGNVGTSAFFFNLEEVAVYLAEVSEGAGAFCFLGGAELEHWLCWGGGV